MTTTTAVTTTPPASILEAYAHEHGMDGGAMYATLAATIFPNGKANRTQVDALLIVARAYRLNPFTRELWAFPSKSGGIVPIVSVDGWLKLATTHPQCAGLEVTVEMGPDGKVPVSATCRVHRHDWKVPFELTEYYHEVKRGTEPWKNQPVRMLRHRAMIQAVRVAFGFGGLYEADEAARRSDVDAPAEYRESEVVQRTDPLSKELQANGTQSPREMGEAEGGSGPQPGAPASPPHAKAIEAFVALGVPAAVIEFEIDYATHMGEDPTNRLRGLHKTARAEGARALITLLKSERAADLLDAHLGADPNPAATATTDMLFGDTEAERED